MLRVSKKAIIYYGGFLRKTGGAFFHARNLEAELVRMGWIVEIITLDKLPIWCKYLPHLVAKIIDVFHTPTGLLFKASLTKRMYRFFFWREADLLVFEDIYLSWNSSCPSITMLHAVWSDNLQAYSISENRLNNFRDSEVALINEIRHPLATVSYPYRDFIVNEHFKGALSKKLGVIELGVDQPRFNDLSSGNRERNSIVYCGVLEARKNLFFLLEVFKKLTELNSDYRLTIIGDGPDRARLTTYAEDNNLPVRFLGRLSYDEVAPELCKHEIYIHTSVKESFSYSLLEAKLAGLVTFAYSKLQIPREFIDVGFESFCIDDWSREVISVSLDRDQFDSSKFTSERMTQCTLSLTNKLGH